MLAAEIALGSAIEKFAVAATSRSPAIIDLLLRLHLAPDRALRGVDLCRQLLKSAGYVSRVIDRAEADGLVRRMPDPDDRRAQRIVLTEAGEAVLDTFVPLAVDVLNRTIYRVLDDHEVDALVDMLRRITDAAQELIDS